MGVKVKADRDLPDKVIQDRLRIVIMDNNGAFVLPDFEGLSSTTNQVQQILKDQGKNTSEVND